jgi:hypothetical protein
MNPRLERRYRRLLVAYPPQVRAARAEEILTTLAESGSGEGRMLSVREAWSLLVEGVRACARLAAAEGPGRIWADGLQLGVLLVMFANLGVLLREAWWYPAWTVLLGATVVAILRARPRVALVLTVVAALAAARPLLPMRLPQGLFGWGAPAYGDWSTVARHVAPVLLLAGLSLPVLRRHLRARAWWWLLVPVAQVAVPVLVVVVARAAGSMGLASIGPAQLERLGELGWTAARSAPDAVVVAAALGLALVARDPRPAIAALVLVAPGLAWALEQRAWLSPLASWYWLVIAVTVPLLVMAVIGADRRQRTEF